MIVEKRVTTFYLIKWSAMSSNVTGIWGCWSQDQQRQRDLKAGFAITINDKAFVKTFNYESTTEEVEIYLIAK